MGVPHTSGPQITWEWPGEEPDEVYVGGVRYVRAKDPWLEPANCFERLVAALQGHDAYQSTAHGGISVDIDRVRAALRAQSK